MSERSYKSAIYSNHSTSYVITITSGAYDDFEHGALFAVSNEKQAVYVCDLLNKYSAFRTRFRELVWEWEFEYSVNTQAATDSESIKQWAKSKRQDMSRFIEDNYALTREFKVAEKLLEGLVDKPPEWQEDVVFAYQALPVHDVDLDVMEYVNGTEQ
jgi:hypothetical protein